MQDVSGEGYGQLALYRLNNPADELFWVGGFQDEEQTATTTKITEVPHFGWVSTSNLIPIIREDGDYVLGAVGFFDEDTAPEFTIEDKRAHFIKAYEEYPEMYVVVMEIK